MLRFNPAPGWPAAPQGWLPDATWRPDPSWPAAPEGWQVVVDDALVTTTSGEVFAYPSQGGGTSVLKVVLVTVGCAAGVVGLLVALAVPAFLDQRKERREDAAVLAVTNVLSRAQAYSAESGTGVLEPTPDESDPSWATPCDLSAWGTEDVLVVEVESPQRAVLVVTGPAGVQTGVRVVLGGAEPLVKAIEDSELERSAERSRQPQQD
jgi:type II secretory pathway pseudopilin PulG